MTELAPSGLQSRLQDIPGSSPFENLGGNPTLMASEKLAWGAPLALALHPPVATYDLSQPGGIDFALAMGGDEAAGFALEVATLMLATPIAGAGDQLPRLGRETGGPIETTEP